MDSFFIMYNQMMWRIETFVSACFLQLACFILLLFPL